MNAHHQKGPVGANPQAVAGTRVEGEVLCRYKEVRRAEPSLCCSTSYDRGLLTTGVGPT
ncbi:MAG: hypothetical protein QGD94_06175 [Planctomycetia bacterium]|nr:hypothetical protein [Planctomycetia bacterium]